MMDALRTGYRALCLGSLLLRAQIEQLAHSEEVLSGYIRGGDLQRLSDWMDEEGVDLYLSPQEQALMAVPLGGWSRQQAIDVSWRTEALGMVLWAIGILEDVPAYDATFTPRMVLPPLRLLLPSGDFFKQVRPRPSEEVSKARDVAELWHWRSRTTRVQRMGIEPPDGLSFPQIIAVTARHAHAQGDLAATLYDDFPAFDKPYADLDEDEYRLATSIAYERHFAMNWLCGCSDEWDDTPTDT